MDTSVKTFIECSDPAKVAEHINCYMDKVHPILIRNYEGHENLESETLQDKIEYIREGFIGSIPECRTVASLHESFLSLQQCMEVEVMGLFEDYLYESMSGQVANDIFTYGLEPLKIKIAILFNTIVVEAAEAAEVVEAEGVE